MSKLYPIESKNRRICPEGLKRTSRGNVLRHGLPSIFVGTGVISREVPRRLICPVMKRFTAGVRVYYGPGRGLKVARLRASRRDARFGQEPSVPESPDHRVGNFRRLSGSDRWLCVCFFFSGELACEQWRA